jgi:hypothetical protein
MEEKEFYKDYNKKRKAIVDEIQKAKMVAMNKQLDIVRQYHEEFCTPALREKLLEIHNYIIFTSFWAERPIDIIRMIGANKDIAAGKIRTSTYSHWRFVDNKFEFAKRTIYNIWQQATVILYPIEKQLAKIRFDRNPVEYIDTPRYLSADVISFIKKTGEPFNPAIIDQFGSHLKNKEELKKAIGDLWEAVLIGETLKVLGGVY